MLKEFLEYKTQSKRTHRSESALRVKSEPNYSVEIFFNRIISIIELDYSTIIISMLYICRYYEKIKPSALNIHKVLLTGIIIAMKFNEDFPKITNHHFAQIAGISTQTINLMEMEFLEEINYILMFSSEEYDYYLDRISDKKAFEGFIKKDLFK